MCKKLKSAQESDNSEAAIQAILHDPETAEKANQLQNYRFRFEKPRLRSFGAERR